jgi:hypothetical protein
VISGNAAVTIKTAGEDVSVINGEGKVAFEFSIEFAGADAREFPIESGSQGMSAAAGRSAHHCALPGRGLTEPRFRL